jgi:predicted HicB family RNase H-like nuclease
VQGLSLLKFVPASGAASRMFKPLHQANEQLRNGEAVATVLEDKEVAVFFENIKKFAFYNDLEFLAQKENKAIETASLAEYLEYLLSDKGLNYGSLPKGLLKFHRYPDEIRTAAEEHFVEGVLYAKDGENKVRLHFTVSPEHQNAFEKLVTEIKPRYERLFGVCFEVSFSQQKRSTDTITANAANKPFRNSDGSLNFSPAGHGALLENVNELNADLIFIKNVDNVVPDELKTPTVVYKKALAGMLLSLQEQIFDYQKKLKDHQPESLESGFYAEVANFLENVLNITPPASPYSSEKEELYRYFQEKLDRPIRICGMVQNQGEPGGGPFFAVNPDGSVSLQIVESTQIDFANPEQAAIAKRASHFNPVDLVCAVKNYQGQKYDLLKFRDTQTGFISVKSKDGKELKVQELPGLWNGSMSDWNTLFVEVPLATFSPVKTINDLLRKEHQVNK